jgi:hypothetical protein
VQSSPAPWPASALGIPFARRPETGPLLPSLDGRRLAHRPRDRVRLERCSAGRTQERDGRRMAVVDGTGSEGGPRAQERDRHLRPTRRGAAQRQPPAARAAGSAPRCRGSVSWGDVRPPARSPAMPRPPACRTSPRAGRGSRHHCSRWWSCARWAPRGAHEGDLHQYAPRRENNTGTVLPKMNSSNVSDQFSM